MSLDDPESSDGEGMSMEPLFLIEVMRLGEAVWAWEEALLVRRVNGSKDHFERSGVAANVDPETKQVDDSEKLVCGQRNP